MRTGLKRDAANMNDGATLNADGVLNQGLLSVNAGSVVDLSAAEFVSDGVLAVAGGGLLLLAALAPVFGSGRLLASPRGGGSDPR